MAILLIRDLVKRREQAGAAFELRVPELVLEPGRFYGVAGPSGSGKSTLLDMLALVLRPTSVGAFEVGAGRARGGIGIGAGAGEGAGARSDVAGMWSRQDEAALAALRKTVFGYVLQSGGLIGFLTVRQNLRLPYQLVGLAPDEGRIAAMAERFGVERELDKKPRYLSIGQRQRVAILRALMLEPPLVLADEPTASVDQLRAHQIVGELKALARETGSTILMVSHDRVLLSGVADRILGLTSAAAADGTAVTTADWETAAVAA